MRVELLYGKGGTVPLNVPDANLAGVYSAKERLPLADPHGAVQEALRNPVGARPLAEICRGKKTACIAITDASRPNIERVVMPVLLEELHAGGIRQEDVTILVGVGSHPPATMAELEEKLGSEILHNYRVENHDCYLSPVDYLGTTSLGVPVEINTLFARADLKIAVGTVLPHPFAGFSGGPKMMAVGIASYRTIGASHSPAMINHPQCRYGNTAGNPFYQSALEVAEMVGLDFIVNGVTREDDGSLVQVVAGEVRAAHGQLVAGLQKDFLVNIPGPADIVVVATGYPKDGNIYHVCALGVCAVAGAAVGSSCVRPGGAIIAVSPMEEGIYNEVFYNTLKEATTPDEVIARVESLAERKPGHHRAYGVAQVLKQYRVIMAQSKMDPEQIRAIHMEAVASAQEALDRELKRYGPAAKVLVLNGTHRMVISVGHGS
ncbi:MAG: lactate racemase [Bacillota bacterium]|nr:lactate racemase [Bacillota bacterium]MDK2924441.1 lactate racemase [Bacillota bacterium]